MRPASSAGVKRISTFRIICRPMLPGETSWLPDPNRSGGDAAKRGEGPSRTLNLGESSLPGGDPSGSAMEWRGVGDKPAKEREARLLTKEEQLLYSG